jgi:hypothetical protein
MASYRRRQSLPSELRTSNSKKLSKNVVVFFIPLLQYLIDLIRILLFIYSMYFPAAISFNLAQTRVCNTHSQNGVKRLSSVACLRSAGLRMRRNQTRTRILTECCLICQVSRVWKVFN